MAGAVLLACAATVPGQTADVRVVHQRTKEPVDNVSVVVRIGRNDANPLLRGRTDAQGRYTVRLDAAKEGAIQVAVHKEGFAPQAMSWPGAGAIPRTVTLELPPNQTVGGLVKDESGKPVAGARVNISFPQRLTGPRVPLDDHPIMTDNEGRWRSDIVPAGVEYVRVSVTHPDYLAGESEPPGLESLQTERAVLTMHSVLGLRGVVLNPQGKPVAGSKVTLGGQYGIMPGRDTKTTETGTDGTFTFAQLKAGPISLGAVAAGFAPAYATVEFKPGAPPVELKLGGPHTLRGRVTDSTGRPLAGVQVRVNAWRGFRYPGLEFSTDAEGRYAWTNAPADEVELDFSKGGFMPAIFQRFTAGPTEHVIALSPPLRVLGSVVDADSSEPIPSFKITGGWPKQVFDPAGGLRTQGAEWSSSSTKSFTGGRYQMDFTRPLVAGTRVPYDFVLKAEAPGYAPGVSEVIRHDAGEATWDFKLRKSVPWTGRLKLPDGKPAAGMTVHYTTTIYNFRLRNGFLERGTRMESVTTDSEGRFTIPQQTEPVHFLAVNDPGLAKLENQRPGDKIPDLQMEAWGTIEGVLTVNDRPAPNQLVALWYPATATGAPSIGQFFLNYQASTDAAGRFRFDRVIPGELAVARVVRPERMIGMTSSGSEVWGACRLTVVRLKPGELVKVEAGSTGRAVTGQFLSPAELKVPADWRYSSFKILRKLPEIPLPRDTTREHQQAWLEKWFWSADGEPYRIWAGGTPQVGPTGHLAQDLHGWSLNIGPDGAFRIDDLPPGEYTLSGYLFAPPASRSMPVVNAMGQFSQVVTVPEGPPNEPVQLGELPLAVKEARRTEAFARAVAAAGAARGLEVPAAEPSEKQSVTAGLRAAYTKISPGGAVAIYVRARIAPGYHIYGLDRSGGDNVPTTLKLILPKGVTTAGNWTAPPPRMNADKTRVYAKEVTFQRLLNIGKDVPPGPLNIKCDLNYQVCNEQACWPPATIPLEISLDVISSP
ncbi:MAG: carboxypeptidase regulatory-like domain-containing protein [Verrucomicrobiota bacterium]